MVPDKSPAGFTFRDAMRVRDAARHVGRFNRSRDPRRSRPSYPQPIEFMIQLTGTAGSDGGYPWQEVALQPLFTITPGASYTHATIAASGGGGTGGTFAGIIGAVGGPTAGQLVGVDYANSASVDGSAYKTQPPPTFAVTGDGTGATVTLAGMSWATTGLTGSTTVAPLDPAYEGHSTGVRSLLVLTDVYFARRDPTTGRLLFFCEPTRFARTTTITTYPTAINAFYAMQDLTLSGTEAEGGAGSAAAGSPTFFAYNLGTTIPPNGTQLVCTLAGVHWTMRYDA